MSAVLPVSDDKFVRHSDGGFEFKVRLGVGLHGAGVEHSLGPIRGTFLRYVVANICECPVLMWSGEERGMT